MNNSWEKTKEVMKYVSPLTWLVVEGMEKSVQAINGASQGSTESLEVEVIKQKMKMEFAQAQARVAQELAIAKRIENAAEVEIEEFYDTSGKGNLGLQADLKAETAALGLGGEGRKITKRIYHFRGWRAEDGEETVQQDINA